MKNRCAICGRFRKWEDIYCHFVPDTSFSSEDESYNECRLCMGEKRWERLMAPILRMQAQCEADELAMVTGVGR